MCGIAGFISFDRDNGRPQWAAIAHSMGEALNHRGPDDKGTWLCPAGALIHRRLAVIDPDRGRQPMTRTRDCAEYTSSTMESSITRTPSAGSFRTRAIASRPAPTPRSS